MAAIDITSTGGGTLDTGVLQLQNGVALDATLRNVADQDNTISPLLLSTNLVQTTSTLKITTADNPYIDAEDNSGNNRFTIGRDPASQIVNVDFASNPTGSTSQVGAIRTYQDGVNLSDVVKFREDGRVTFTERVNVEADSLVTTESCSVIAASTTNANLVIAPNGTGGLIASIPDGTATGGDARGNYAVDLQMSRSNSNRVASGQASFVVGSDSRATTTTCVAMGDTCTASGTSAFAVGAGSVASGQYSVAMGFYNTASSTYSTVSGGQQNTASTGINATVVGGKGNTASGNYSVSGGQNATASGTRSIAFGESATASGTNSVCLGGGSAQGEASTALAGAGNNALSSYSLAQGYVTQTDLRGQVAFSGTGYDFPFERGFCQQSTLVANREATLTTGGTTVLSLDGTGVTNLIIPNGNNRMWNVQVRWVAVVKSITGTATGVTVGDTKVSTDLLAVAKRSGTTTVGAHTSAGTSVIETTAGSLTAVNIVYSAGASQQMAITFAAPTFLGGGSVTMRVVAAISLTEVAYT